VGIWAGIGPQLPLLVIKFDKIEQSLG
jgi:hypothetical protein